MKRYCKAKKLDVIFHFTSYPSVKKQQGWRYLLKRKCLAEFTFMKHHPPSGSKESQIHLSNEKNPCCLGYIEDYTKDPY